ncbi:hypothetical protein ODE01S_02410 [Oceanithermus desulfurans NBRC 100063]|uniref:Endonuclease GajA/Old nuclease/RecF-like AAA domain-containing protein n=2 Tax=Oceanithermus desulfurans TaxID=227924 RepID=A0A511RI84_9DEIN|nr:hypothetical protein ODE01S_02410 [Oceanithermus desulfurans NBRC 100063]
MALITRVAIRNFRSFRNLEVKPFCPYTSITGLNNAGKSNVLRALNLFFNEEIEPGKSLDWERDYNIFVSRKQKKEISVEVEFSLPDIFNFPKPLKAVIDIPAVSNNGSFSIKKVWHVQEDLPSIYLNGKSIEDDKAAKGIRGFLSLIKYVYIPHYVSPLKLFDADSVSFIAEALHRLRKGGKKKTGEDSLDNFLGDLRKQIGHLWSEVSTALNRSTGASVELSAELPSSLEELVSNLKLRLSMLYEQNHVIGAELQGAGVQLFTALLLLYSLHRSQPGRSFGWLQAIIWGVEEPENSLHKSLEAEIAAFFQRNARENPRFQFIITTHSEIFAGYSNCIISLKKEGLSEAISTVFQGKDGIREGLKEMGKAGIGIYTEPILTNPTSTIVLVEGKSDKFIVQQALRCLQVPKEQYMVLSPEDLGMHSGGTPNIEKVLDKLSKHFAYRPGNLCILLDWETKEKTYNKIKKLIEKLGDKNKNGFYIVKLDDKNADPKVSKGFKGIERFLSYSYLRKLCEDHSITLVKETKEGVLVIEDPSNYNHGVKSKLQQVYMNDTKLSCESIQPLIKALKPVLKCLNT